MLCMILAMADTPEDKIKVEALYNEYDRLMYYIAGKILHNHADIEDAVMDSWVRIVRNLDKISEISSPKTKSYVVVIVERAAINILNRVKRHEGGEVPIAEYDQSPFFATSDKEYENVEMYEVLKNLPKEYSDPLILYYMQELTTKEIAKTLGVSEDAVYKRLQRGREMLKSEWK